MKVRTNKVRQKSEKTSGIAYPGILLTMDMFSEPVPNFNIRGKSEVRTHCGGCLSIAITCAIIMFAAHKFLHLLFKLNPTVNIFTKRDALDVTDIWRYSD